MGARHTPLKIERCQIFNAACTIELTSCTAVPILRRYRVGYETTVANARLSTACLREAVGPGDFVYPEKGGTTTVICGTRSMCHGTHDVW